MSSGLPSSLTSSPLSFLFYKEMDKLDDTSPDFSDESSIEDDGADNKVDITTLR